MPSIKIADSILKNIQGAPQMSPLSKAIVIAATAHDGQIDKGGHPYIFHLLRVMMEQETDESRIVGVLHDLFEDCDWTQDDLRRHGFSEEIIAAVESVTRRQQETYKEFIKKAASNPIGRKVKLADLRDNCDLERLPHASDIDYQRVEKYQRAITFIEDLFDEKCLSSSDCHARSSLARSPVVQAEYTPNKNSETLQT